MQIKKPIIIFDGLCKLCNNSIRFILKRDKKKQFHFVTLQSEEGIECFKTYKISEKVDSVVLINNKKAYLKSDAAIEISRFLPVPWRWIVVFKTIRKPWRDNLYLWIAKNRYRWFGKNNSCSIT